MHENPLRIGIIGASPTLGWARHSHLPAVRALPEYQMAAGCAVATASTGIMITRAAMSCRHAVSLLAALLIASSGTGAIAQAYPSRTVRIMVGYTPGGFVDIVARLIAPKMSESMHSSVIVDNRPGAGANLAAELLSKSPPDGYTALIVNTALPISAAIYRRLNYDALRDLAPVGLVANSSHLLIVHPSLPVRSAKDLIALARARPGQLNFASGGLGTSTHLPGELLKSLAGIDMVHIPYKGGADAATAVVTGEASMYFSGISVGLPLAKAGRVRSIAVTTRQRSSIAPEIPTMEESGVPGFEDSLWAGIFVPAGTPTAIVARLNAEILKALDAPDVRERLASIGAEPYGSTPEQLGTRLKGAIDKYGKIVRAIGLRRD